MAFKSERYTFFGVEVFTTLEPGKVIYYNYMFGGHEYFTRSLESVVIDIIARKNGCQYFAVAACKLLEVNI